jgi:hypothetical protein
MNCKLCESDCENPEPATVATGICGTCRNKLGIIPMPPSRRRAKPCSSCNSMRFVRVIPREFTATGGDYVHSSVAPMTATVKPETEPKLIFSGRTVSDPKPRLGVGMLEMYICSGCGLVEWHCLDPEAIPIGAEYMTEVVDYAAGSAYRD